MAKETITFYTCDYEGKEHEALFECKDSNGVCHSCVRHLGKQLVSQFMDANTVTVSKVGEITELPERKTYTRNDTRRKCMLCDETRPLTPALMSQHFNKHHSRKNWRNNSEPV